MAHSATKPLWLQLRNHPSLFCLHPTPAQLAVLLEHIADAQQVFKQLQGLLKPSGLLAIMTKRVRDHAGFIHWHYKHDPTHINFYSEATFGWIAQTYQWQLEIIDNDVVFFRVP